MLTKMDLASQVPNPRVLYSGNIFKVDPKGPDTQLGDMTFQQTSNIPNLTSYDTTIVYVAEEKTHIPYVSLICKKYLKRD